MKVRSLSIGARQISLSSNSLREVNPRSQLSYGASMRE